MLRLGQVYRKKTEYFDTYHPIIGMIWRIDRNKYVRMPEGKVPLLDHVCLVDSDNNYSDIEIAKLALMYNQVSEPEVGQITAVKLGGKLFTLKSYNDRIQLEEAIPFNTEMQGCSYP